MKPDDPILKMIQECKERLKTKALLEPIWEPKKRELHDDQCVCEKCFLKPKQK